VRRRTELIVIGASWGGQKALEALIGALPADLPCPIAVAQHRAATDSPDVAGGLARVCALPVSDALDKDLIAPGRVYVAPADYHLLVESRGSLALATTAPVNSARPSIDVLFDTAAEAYGPATAGVILTGASADGAAGLASIEARGGVVMVQDPATAECGVMPAAAVAATSAPLVLPLAELARELIRLAAHR
jgi:two-component system chemotaxis response regulator CheB